MAAAIALLRLGRAGTRQTVQLEAWGFRDFASTVSVHAKSENSKKERLPEEAKKQRAPKTLKKGGTVARNNPENTRLTNEEFRKALSRKTSVDFPQRASASPFRGKGVSSAKSRSSKKLEDDSSSSSSSSSSTSSDSDSDGEDSTSHVATKPQISFKTNVEFPRRKAAPLPSSSEKTRKPPEEKSLNKKAQAGHVHLKKTDHLGVEAAPIEKFKAFEDARNKAKIGKAEETDSFKKRNAKETYAQRREFNFETLRENQKPTAVKPTLSHHPQAGALAQMKGSLAPGLEEETRAGKQLEPVPPRTKEQIGGEKGPVVNLEAAASQAKGDILEPTIPEVNQEAEEIIQDSAQREEQGTLQEPEPAAEPPEPFDNSTYKNLQHHEYTAFTFLDFNLDLSKFRLPQPSSGKESPRH
ncbi:NADH dehydrogenase [ubiquinone] flavoprotein 3, mitochondrial [Tachyglossus aculeatus]|uniref:NADH dehydrogenase [ubiquinone] flavoprotein 3, mitochondrial n=1 Tax=Tachyglossus aculeatus TaxID=9261 RepID=UPI0018F2B934|nr:NADH dehydrogenase [ubiquinone] flavoprotein 3, mitochondrial [Tachyglossus aculeatus]